MWTVCIINAKLPWTAVWVLYVNIMKLAEVLMQLLLKLSCLVSFGSTLMCTLCELGSVTWQFNRDAQKLHSAQSWNFSWTCSLVGRYIFRPNKLIVNPEEINVKSLRYPTSTLVQQMIRCFDAGNVLIFLRHCMPEIMLRTLTSVDQSHGSLTSLIPLVLL